MEAIKMKTKVNYQAGVIKYLPIVLLVSLILTVFFYQITNQKVTYQVYTIDRTVKNNNPSFTPFGAMDLVTNSEVQEELIANENCITNVSAPTLSSENLESEIVLEDWMLATEPWTINESEEVVLLTDWMVTTEPIAIVEENSDDVVILEDWMVETSAWNQLEEEPLISEPNESIKLQNWMVNEDAWKDYNSEEIEDFNLLTANN
jgi:hypothetical protein